MRVLASMLLLVFLLGGEAYAQVGDYFFGFAYETSLPSGNAADFAEGFSWRGASFGGRRMIKEDVSVGFLAGWHVMNHETSEVGSLQGENFGLDVQGTQFRYINSFPIMLNAHYYGGFAGNLRPYIGLNAGLYYIERRLEIGIYYIDEDNWHFGLGPEVGLVFPLNWHARGFINARYNWAASSGGSGSINYWNFSIGAAWM